MYELISTIGCCLIRIFYRQSFHGCHELNFYEIKLPACGMKVTERQKLNVFEMKCLRSMTGISRLDRVGNEVVRARTDVRRELAARVDMNVLR